MGPSIMNRIQAKLELFRLEKRYTRYRNRRSTFVSNAIYVDGEYIYQTPNPTGSSADSTASRIDALHGERAIAVAAAKRNCKTSDADLTTNARASATPEHKKLNRCNTMPSFKGSIGPDDGPRAAESPPNLLR